MLRLLSALLLALCAFSCGPKYLDYFPYHDDGSAKPRVAMLPVQDCSGATLPWNIAHAFTCGMRYEMMNSGQLYLLSDQEMQLPLAHFTDGITFLTDESPLAEQFCEADFIVLTELMDHHYAPLASPIAPTAPCFPRESLLVMKMRIKIVDVRRTRCPRIVLQEIVTDCCSVPKIGEETDLAFQEANSPWTNAMRRAHKHMMCKVTSRIEEAIGGSY
jgi:hypothetical protein